MPSLAEIQAEHRRRAILCVLAEDANYETNAEILCAALDAVGLTASRDQVVSDLAWLQEQGLVITTTPSGSLVLAKLTDRGLDVAQCRASVPGIARPRPE